MIGFSADDFLKEDQLEAQKPESFSDDYWNSIKGTYYEITSNDLSLWETDSENGAYWLRLNSQSKNPKAKDNIFQTAKSIDGNQVWANGAVVPETRGLWFYTDNNVQTNGGKWIISDEGMQLNGYSGWPNSLVVPNVPKNAAVYLRMKNTVNTPHFAYSFKGDGGSEVYPSNGKPMLVPGTEHEDNGVNYAEYIFAIKNNGNTKRHLVLSFGGYELKKLAVSLDPKSVNSKGWASESRTRDIDAALTSYLTGKPIKTYFAGQPNYDNRTLILTDISNSASNHVMPKETGCVLYSTSNGKVVILDGGFHLFVPDMHDKTGKLANPEATTEKGNVNMLKPQLEQILPLEWKETIGTTEYNRYLLSYKYYIVGKDDQITGQSIEGPEMFYRIAKNQNIGLKANSAYLILPTSEITPSWAAGAKYSFLFVDWDDLVFDEQGGIATGLEGVKETGSSAQYGNVGWYTINGQKLSGKPTTSGFYIVNGKKVVIKK
jgi:hypothetical protein